uniref:Double C2 domain alpha n=1 Tax=Macaca fascicularis TaxID=9541 RepID=A0A7N9IBQ5_MACFA
LWGEEAGRAGVEQGWSTVFLSLHPTSRYLRPDAPWSSRHSPASASEARGALGQRSSVKGPGVGARKAMGDR